MAVDPNDESADLMARIEAAGEKLRNWPRADEDLLANLPEEGLCALCYGRDLEHLPKHFLLVMCPSGPSVFLHTMVWDEDLQSLKKEHSYAIDRTAIPGSMEGLVRILYGLPLIDPDDESSNGHQEDDHDPG